MAETRPPDILLPASWDWQRVEAERAKWGLDDTMVPVAVACRTVAWATINSVRAEQREGTQPEQRKITHINEFGTVTDWATPADADEPPSKCTGECRGVPASTQWAYTGTAYGGDDPEFHGEGRCYCIFCGEDGDA